MLEGEILAGPQLATCDLPRGAMGSAAFLPLAFLCRRPLQRPLLYSLASASFDLTSGLIGGRKLAPPLPDPSGSGGLTPSGPSPLRLRTPAGCSDLKSRSQFLCLAQDRL